jgi:quercetin dioxygenase-like cupin family protein
MRIELKSAEWIDGPGYRKNRLADEVALACPGTLVQRVEITPHDMIPDHVHHTTTEFYYVVAGQCRLVVNAVSHNLVTGDSFLITPGDVHRLYNDSAETFQLLVFKTNTTEADTSWRVEYNTFAEQMS